MITGQQAKDAAVVANHLLYSQLKLLLLNILDFMNYPRANSIEYKQVKSPQKLPW